MVIVIDTDAGVDDALALQLALAHPTAHIEAITTVIGNIDVDAVTRNVMTTLKLMGREELPVYRGAALPLISTWHNETEFVHGIDGLGDWAGRPISDKQSETEHAALALIRLANENPGEITLVALAPMTNIALAVRLDSTFASKIKRLVWMGGAMYGIGNTDTFTAEFNAHIDPEALHIVLSAFAQSTMISWETSLKYALTWDEFDALVALPVDTPVHRMFAAITAHWSKVGRALPTVRGFAMPDPLAMAIALYPEIVTRVENRYVTVELGGTHTRGMTPVDFPKMSGHTPNVDIVMDIEGAALYGLYRRLLTDGHL